MGLAASTALSLPSSQVTSSCSTKPPSLVRLGLPSLNPQSWITSFARKSILSVLDQAITIGYLEITDTDGFCHTFGREADGCNKVSLKIVNDDFWMRVLTASDLGFSEAYIFGDVQISDLNAVMNLWLDNEPGMSALSSALARFTSAASGLFNGFLGQTKWRARANVIASYDQSNELFKAFLSEEMMYSCAVWGPEEGGVRGDLVAADPTPPTTDLDLEAAQLRKIHHVLTKARVFEGCRLLEFGSGWGGLSIIAARDYGCSVDTLTLSIEQKELAEERIKKAGLEDRIRVHLMDYRDVLNVPEWEKEFDAFVSVEMLEHVGAKYYNLYFKIVDYALKSQNATAVVSASTFPESRYTGYQSEDFMRRYMWPNSCLPSATALVNAAHQSSQGRFTLENVENHAAHYPRTLRTWAVRLESNLSQFKIAADFPSLQRPEEYQAFKRKWAYFFAYAEAGFLKGWITCHMLTFVRENDRPVE